MNEKRRIIDGVASANPDADTWLVGVVSGADKKFKLSTLLSAYLNDALDASLPELLEDDIWGFVAKYRAAMVDAGNTDAFAIDTTDSLLGYHTNGLAALNLGSQWTFDAGYAGTPISIASVADGADSGVDIEFTTSAPHGLAIGDVVTISGCTDTDYNGIFVVKAVISTTKFEVANTEFDSTDTGTVNHGAYLLAGANAAGVYRLDWSMSAIPATELELFDGAFYNDGVVIPGSQFRHAFGAGPAFGHLAGCVPHFTVVAGQRIGLMIQNTDTAGNLTIRNLAVNLSRV